MKKQPWIYSLLSDGIFIIAPPFVSLLIVLFFPSVFRNEQGISTSWWVVLILGIDVAHVYSTLYRTYFDRATFRQQKSVLITIPLLALAATILLYAISAALFWRLLAYLAVFHFVRQQYGFMRIYSRQEQQGKWPTIIDKITIYSATFYPILYWHLHAPRNFNWFTEDDFWYFESPSLSSFSFWIYVGVIVVYLIKEGLLVIRNRSLNLPRNLVIAGTLLSWYFGIVYFNGDLAFTLLNVVSHGIPYMALIWMYGKKKINSATGESYHPVIKRFFTEYGAVLFVISIICFAYIEEGFWDIWIWKEHSNVFPAFSFLGFEPGKELLAIMVPILALPQVTHYIIDGFIWKVSKGQIPFKQEEIYPVPVGD